MTLTEFLAIAGFSMAVVNTVALSVWWTERRRVRRRHQAGKVYRTHRY